VAGPARLEEFTELICGELNIQSVVLLDVAQASASEYGVSSQLSVNARAAVPDSAGASRT